MILLFEVVGKGDKAVPEQILATCVNVGVVFGVTEIIIVWLVAHWFSAGVKVYVVVAAIFNDGDHVPVILLFDVVGKGDKAVPEQILATCVNVGVVFGVTEIIIVWLVAH